MISLTTHENHEQTAAVMTGLAARSAGAVAASPDLAVWHDLQRWIALGPNDVVIPFAPQVAAAIPPAMIRFRRDVGALLNFVKASAILHQALRQVDEQGRVVATIADYALAYPIFSHVMAESAGKSVPESVRKVVQLIADRAGSAAAQSTGMRFQRAAAAGPGSEVTISSDQVGTATGLGKSGAYRAITTALNRGFLANNEVRPSKPFRFIVKRGIDETDASLLPDPQTISQEGGAA
jgi:hypothetical protein